MKEILIALTIMLLVFSCCVTENKSINESGNDSCVGEIEGMCPLNLTVEASTTNASEVERIKNEELLKNLNQELIGQKQGTTTTTTTTASIVSVPVTRPLNNLVDRIEVYHFHGNSQCYSCKTIGAYAEETVNKYFSEELKSGKLVFAHINYDLPENKTLAVKYGVTGSSLWIGTYKGGTFTPEQNINVWYKINNKEDFMNYLKGVIGSKLEE